MRYILTLLAALGTVSLMGCDTGPKGSVGFTLPDGDAELGKLAFVELQCHACHSVNNVELPAPQETGIAQFQLGGKTTRVKTYGNLVTSVINPSHKLAQGYVRNQLSVPKESPMRNYNDVTTVQQLVDLVAFLQPTYQVVAPETHHYAYSL